MRTVFITVLVVFSALGTLSGCSLYFTDHPTPHNPPPDARNSNDGGNPWPVDDGGSPWPDDASDDGGHYFPDGGSDCGTNGGSPDGGSWPWPDDAGVDAGWAPDAH